MLGEIKDSLSFYYDEHEFEFFIKFFEFLDGAYKFDYSKYLEAYARFLEFIGNQGRSLPEFMKSEQEFIQFLYDLNIICFIDMAEDEKFIHWCFIERSPTNISPKVKIDAEYEIHYSLANVLNTGKEFRSRRIRASEAPITRGQTEILPEGSSSSLIRRKVMDL